MSVESTKRLSLRERRQVSTRNDLVQSALAVIAETGTSDLAAVTIGRILSDSGMARATLYAHFPGGREELLAAAYQHVAHQFLDNARSAIESRGGEKLNWTQRVEAYAEALLAVSADTGIGYFYNISGPQLLGFSKDRGVGSTGVFTAFSAELHVGTREGKIPSGSSEPLAVLLAGSMRDAGIQVALNPDTAAELLGAFRFLLRCLDETHNAGA